MRRFRVSGDLPCIMRGLDEWHRSGSTVACAIFASQIIHLGVLCLEAEVVQPGLEHYW